MMNRTDRIPAKKSELAWMMMAWTPIFLEPSNRFVTVSTVSPMEDEQDRQDVETRKEHNMPRKPKHPNHAADAQRLMNELLDMTVQVWTSEKDPELKAIAEECEMSPAKLRKLLITASVRDHTSYYSSDTADMVLKLSREGKSVAEIMEQTGLSHSSVTGYLPHKSVYNLDTMSSECERIRLFRSRKAAVADLHAHLGLPDESLWLWKAVIAFEGYPFSTAGRGSRPGVKFKYTVSRAAGAGGRHYEGEAVEGYGNELWVTSGGEQLKKSISRSTVDLALKKTREKEIKGPKSLGVPGAASYLFALFVRFGLV